MPVWIWTALRLMAAAGIGGAAFEAGARALPGGQPMFGTGDPDGEDYITGRRAFPQIIDMQRRKKRRRRRRALTASDRADIAFIVGLLGPTAGKNFAVTLAGRSR